MKRIRLIPRSRPARIAAIVLLLAGGSWWLARGGKKNGAAEWVEVGREDLVLGVEVTGTLKAVESSVLGPPQVAETWNFKISMLAPEGSDVKAGDPVLAFDSSELDRKLEQKQAEAAAARKQIEKKEIDADLLRRQDDLRHSEAEARARKAALKVDRPGDLSAANELRQAKLDLELAREEMTYLEQRAVSARGADDAELRSLARQRDQAELRVREIQDAIRKMTLKAARDGTVIYMTDWREEKKKVGDTCWRGEQVLEIPDLRKMIAKGEVDEADSGKVEVGQPVTLRLDAHPDVEFHGKVASIWKTVQRRSYQNPLKVVRLDISLEKTDAVRMRPGMRFRGTIETGRVKQCLVISTDAVFPRPEGPVAYRKTVLGFEAVPLELGRRNDKLIEVLGGIRENDRVSRRDLAPAETRGA